MTLTKALLSILFAQFLVAEIAWSAPEIMSYKQWKRQRVEQSKMIHEKLLDLRSHKLELSRENNLRLRKARMKRLMMEELTPTDYFQQYLIRNYPNNFRALEVAADKMSSQELAEIMKSYAYLLSQKNAGEVASKR